MVLSKFLKNYDYLETDKIHSMDKLSNIELYKTEQENIPIVVGVGQPKEIKITSTTLIIYPVYFLSKSNVTKIGVIEMKKMENVNYESFHHILSDNNFLLFHFLPFSNLHYIIHREDKLTEADLKNAKENNNYHSSLFSVHSRHPTPTTTPTTTTISMLTKDNNNYKNGLQSLFHDEKFTLLKMPENGNSLFSAIFTAFGYTTEEEMQKKITDLRNYLSEQVTEALFAQFSTIYHHSSSGELHQEFSFMDGIKTRRELQEKIKDSSFFANDWAIAFVEQHLQIKLILFNNCETWTKHSCQLLCTHGLPNITEFKPKYYIIVSKDQNNHFHLVEYDHIKQFQFKQIPLPIKQKILSTCMQTTENKDSIFHKIPDFQTFFNNNNKNTNNTNRTRGGVNNPILFGKKMYTNEIIFVVQQPEDPMDAALVAKNLSSSSSSSSSLLEKNTSKKKETNLWRIRPGKMSGELLPMKYILEFTDLAKVPMWRNKLSTKWLQTFYLSNLRWASVKHYCEAAYFESTHPEFFRKFSLDAATHISMDPDLAIMARLFVTNKIQTVPSISRHLQTIFQQFPEIQNEFASFPKNIRSQTNFEQENNALYNAHYAKFQQNEPLKQLLCATKNATLICFSNALQKKHSSPSPVFLIALMKVRQSFLWPNSISNSSSFPVTNDDSSNKPNNPGMEKPFVSFLSSEN